MSNLGKIESISLRDVWNDEARDFTPWLASENGLALLGEALGIELELIATESRTGPYKSDIVAKIVDEEEERIVVIENQLEPTNHDHLGKIVTYASGHNAVTAVWVAQSFTDEHRQALDWLNENMPDIAFFALEIGLIRIGTSNPAPQFKIVSSPNEWAKAIRASRAKQISGVKLDQLRYWEELREYANGQPNQGPQFTRKPRPQHWYNLAIGRSGFRLTVTVSSVAQRAGCEIFMHDEFAKQFFDFLYQEKEEIETDLGYELDWQRLEDRKGSRIAVYTEGLIEKVEDRERLKEWHFEKTVEFYKAFSQRLQGLSSE